MTVSNETMKRPVLVGLIGADIQMSKSPALHQREGALQGLDYRYELLDLAERGLPPTALPNLLAEEEARGFAGSNITHPCKQTVIEYLTDLSGRRPYARRGQHCRIREWKTYRPQHGLVRFLRKLSARPS